MISRITGRLEQVGEESALIFVEPFHYEILIPDFTRRQIQNQSGESVQLHTIHYVEGNAAQGGRMVPRLIGFMTEVEREFFELFCSVDGVGVKKALRAMVRPVQEVATLIETANADGLSTLPGIGPATADRIIAKLRRKMPKFALLVQRDEIEKSDIAADIVEETYLLLCNLGHSESDARELIDSVLATKKRFKDVESLLNAVYQNRK